MSRRWLPRGFGRIGFMVLALAGGLLGWQRLADAPQVTLVADPTIGRTLAIGLTTPLPGRGGFLDTGQRQSEPHLVNLFASWCVPCRAEAPVLAGLKARGIRIDAVAVRDEAAAVSRFLKRTGDPFAGVGLDPLGRVQAALGVSGLPETYAVDAHGMIIFRHRGALGPDDGAKLAQHLR